jgi:hypothetical protein
MIDTIDHPIFRGGYDDGKAEALAGATTHRRLRRKMNKWAKATHRSFRMCIALAGETIGTIDTVAHGHGKLPFFAVPTRG